MDKIILALFALIIITSCNNKNKKALTKRWRVADVTFIDAQKSMVQSDTMQGNMLQRQRAVLRDVLIKNLYEFNADGTYITGNAAGSATGRWELTSNAITFISDEEKEGGKSTKNIPFEHLSDDSLVLVLDNDQTSVKLKLLLLPVE
ncbi:MAG: hypothetical protein KBE91_12120 [Bacteroidia bacterium]|nr:hypothetical protein [Bacteroidia bacterium]MBP9690353.1 hypothetical protein [Bacteroidia bacterium]